MHLHRFLAPIISASIVLSGCILSDDIDNFYFQLPEKTFFIDTSSLGLSTNTDISCDPNDDQCHLIDPSLSCDSVLATCAISETVSMPSIDCSEEDICMEMGDAFYCDTNHNACGIKAPIQLSTAVHLAEEVEELREVGNLTFAKVSIESLYFTVEVNTLGVESPVLGIYVANNGVLELSFDEDGEVITPGCRRIGSLPSVPAGFTGKKDVILTEPGREALNEYLREPNIPFKLFVAGTVSVAPGQNLPNIEDGQFRVVVSGTALAKTAL